MRHTTRFMRRAGDAGPRQAERRLVLRSVRRILPELGRFTLAGGAGTLVGVGGFNLLVVGAGVDAVAANVAAQGAAALVAYVLAAKFVFPHAGGRARSAEVAVFLVVAVGGTAYSTAVLAAVDTMTHGRLPVLVADAVLALTIVTGWMIRFVLVRRVVFRAHLPRGPAGARGGASGVPGADPRVARRGRQMLTERRIR